jgi:MFS family permease
VLIPPQSRVEPVHIPATRASLHGLDWLNFFLASVQTGFGPFLSVYLTAHGWTQTDIGVLLSISGGLALLGQFPGGAAIDAAPSVRRLMALAIVCVAASATFIAVQPNFISVLSAQVLHVIASCIIGPGIAALSLGLVGHDSLGERLGRNARFSSVGAGIAAALMGAIGGWLSTSAVFFVTAILAGPAILALSHIHEREVDLRDSHGGVPDPSDERSAVSLRNIITNKSLLIFCACLMFFHLANSAMMPLVAGMVTMRSSELASVLVAACIIAPQIVVAVSSPWIGRQAQLRGRRLMFLIGFIGVPVRGALFAFVSDPHLLVAVQVLDGISAAAMGVLTPLIVADLTRNTGHFNAALGILGTATGIGASLSPPLAGFISDHFGNPAAFLTLAAIAIIGLLLAWLFLPETRRSPTVAASSN